MAAKAPAATGGLVLPAWISRRPWRLPAALRVASWHDVDSAVLGRLSLLSRHMQALVTVRTGAHSAALAARRASAHLLHVVVQ